jgi:hypothetical protein
MTPSWHLAGGAADVLTPDVGVQLARLPLPSRSDPLVLTRNLNLVALTRTDAADGELPGAQRCACGPGGCSSRPRCWRRLRASVAVQRLHHD